VPTTAARCSPYELDSTAGPDASQAALRKGRTPARSRRHQIAEIDQQRRKPFELYYDDKISADSFHTEDLG
jgi:hypothetical protein